MAASAARARCARIRPPPSRPLDRRQRLARGVRAHRAPGCSLPRAGLLSVAAPRVRARTCREHTPPSGLERPGPRSRSDPPPSSSLSHSALGCRRVPASRGGKRGLLCPYVAREDDPLPGTSSRRGLQRNFMGFPYPWSARPPPYQDPNFGEDLRFPFF